MLNKTCKLILAVSFALVALMASANPVAAQTSRYDLRMENDSGYPIYQLYFSPSSSGAWGSDRLGARILHDGETVRIPSVSPRLYDLKFVFRSGVACEVDHVLIDDDEFVDLTADDLLESCDWIRP